MDTICAMAGDSVIHIVKAAPSDKLAKKVLVDWYSVVRPKWIMPLNWILVFLCAVFSIFFFSLPQTPPAAWAALAGFLVALAAAVLQVPFLVKKAVQINKRSPHYYTDKIYDFGPDYVVFSCEGLAPMTIKYAKFTKVIVSPAAMMFLYGEKLAMWLDYDGMTNEEAKKIEARFEKAGVPVRYIG